MSLRVVGYIWNLRRIYEQPARTDSKEHPKNRPQRSAPSPARLRRGVYARRVLACCCPGCDACMLHMHVVLIMGIDEQSLGTHPVSFFANLPYRRNLAAISHHLNKKNVAI